MRRGWIESELGKAYQPVAEMIDSANVVTEARIFAHASTTNGETGHREISCLSPFLPASALPPEAPMDGRRRSCAAWLDGLERGTLVVVLLDPIAVRQQKRLGRG
jgi:hypothetical protein